LRIAYITAGAGAMYCGACARDAILARELIRQKHDLQLIPLYTPLKLDDDHLPFAPLFFGGINVYLQQASALFRRLPARLDRILDHPALLRWLSRRSIEIDPAKLGPMTVSMLQGRDGRQKKEVDRLLAYLQTEFHPQVVNLTNALLSGLAPEIKRRLKVPVLCTYQGEDQFLADLPQPWRAQALELVQVNAKFIDGCICPSQAMVKSVAAFLDRSEDRIKVIPTAIDMPAPHSAFGTRHSALPVIGHLSSIRRAKGLDTLVEALRILVQQQQRDVQLRVAGRVMDAAFWHALRQTIDREKLTDHFHYVGEVDAAGKQQFLSQCRLFVAASRYPEPRGVAVVEAMAAGVPVIVPDTGVFPELLASGGGILYPSGNALQLANAIARALDNPAELAAMATAAADTISQHFAPSLMAAETLAVYNEVCAIGARRFSS